jgi:hypothetical protein
MKIESFYLRKHNEERVRIVRAQHTILTSLFLYLLFTSPHILLFRTAYTPLTLFIRYCWYVSDL